MNAFGSPDKYKIVSFANNEEDRKRIIYFDLYDPNGSGEESIGIIVPSGISVQNIINASECREKRRFPTLAYVYRKNGN